MANKLISEMGLRPSIANIFAARNIVTAKDALSLTEFELMELLDVSLDQVTSAVAHISEIACPPYQTALVLMEEKRGGGRLVAYLPTSLKGLDDALCGGIPFGMLTEMVGPAGIGKTQFCLKLALLAALPKSHGGLDGHVVYIDTESKFSSKRMMEIGANSFPEVFSEVGKAQEMAGRIIVLKPSTLSEFTKNLQQIKVSLLQQKVKLLIIDSMAALIFGGTKKIPNGSISTNTHYTCFSYHEFEDLYGTSLCVAIDDTDRDSENSKGSKGKHSLAWHISFLKSLAELSQIPIFVTNQVRANCNNETSQYLFEASNKFGRVKHSDRIDSELIAALGIHWAHAVSVRIILEANSGQRYMKVAKCPISPPLVFPFTVTLSGISLLSDNGIEILGPEIHSIRSQGHSDLICGERL